MPNAGEGARVLSDAEIGQFVRDGYVLIEQAFSRSDAEAGRGGYSPVEQAIRNALQEAAWSSSEL